jgi:hypothetical protein
VKRPASEEELEEALEGPGVAAAPASSGAPGASTTTSPASNGFIPNRGHNGIAFISSGEGMDSLPSAPAAPVLSWLSSGEGEPPFASAAAVSAVADSAKRQPRQKAANMSGVHFIVVSKETRERGRRRRDEKVVWVCGLCVCRLAARAVKIVACPATSGVQSGLLLLQPTR